jgi:hypothetical protein
VYRLPVADGAGRVSLRTVLAQSDGPAVSLFDGGTGALLGRGVLRFGWNGEAQPLVLEGGALAKLSLFVRDGVFEEAGERPYGKVPLPPLARGTATVSRVRLEAGSDVAELVELEGSVFAETPRPQPELGAPPPVLTALLSVAGAGLWLPSEAGALAQWRDATSELVPPDRTKAIACAAPFASVYRPRAKELVDVPAGTLEALPIVEVVDTCRAPNAPELKVFEVTRRFVPGLGPVAIAVTTSDATTWRFLLVSHTVPAGSAALWPLVAGASWTYEVEDAAGVPAGTVTVSVTGLRSVSPLP